MEGGFLARKS